MNVTMAANPSSTLTAPSMYKSSNSSTSDAIDTHSASPVISMETPAPATTATTVEKTDIRICVNDVTVDGSRDYETMSETERAFLDALRKQQRRRSSWCPEQEKKKEDKQEKIRMLAVSGRRSVHLVMHVGDMSICMLAVSGMTGGQCICMCGCACLIAM